MSALPLYHHGAISKAQCEQLLGEKAKDGAYLVRDSETILGAMCLCVYKQKTVYTYRLLRTQTGHITIQATPGVKDKIFKSLDDLVRHFKRRGQGLAMHLRHSVKRKTTYICPQNSTIEELDYESPDCDPDYILVLPS
ncbi:SH2 domain-containing protein 1B2 [Lampris incognitus]|uniref:SH2 domain-containing protein 1B2 n=1 Tax=Lampris incognitus TaxID=2546036 RepID=UPI0024B50016|nr:SH2 domain-containing protein 1B2 [Lampris incognitus]